MQRPCTDGFAFVEFVDSAPNMLCRLFQRMGFRLHRAASDGRLMLMTQGLVTFLVNCRPNRFYESHGTSVRGFGLWVHEPEACAERTLAAGAGRFDPIEDGEPVFAVPTVRGIGDSLLYFMSRSGQAFSDIPLAPKDVAAADCAIVALDHVSHIVRPESLDRWAQFYREALDFSEGQYLEVRGQRTGMRARSMISPCGNARIPVAASAHDDPGAFNQNDEFIRDYGGEGIQHLALHTQDIFRTVDAMRASGFEFMDAPAPDYYQRLEHRVPKHGFPLEELQCRGILVDGSSGQDMLLQIFTRRQVGPIFFEIIQRINHNGFGEGNFRELFEAQEKDQLRRTGQV